MADKWTPEEYEWLRRYLTVTPWRERSSRFASKELGRTIAAIHLKASRTGLSFGPSEEEKRALHESISDYYANTADREFDLYHISDKLGVSRASIAGYASKVGLTRRSRKKHAKMVGPSPARYFKTLKSIDLHRHRARFLYDIQDVPCQKCGKKVSSDRHHIDGDPSNNHPSNISFLCRRCHMVEDGRLQRLIEYPKQEKKPPSPCHICGKPSRPLRKGRCHACNEYFSRRGVERSVLLQICHEGVHNGKISIPA